jgi:hypothetical protein
LHSHGSEIKSGGDCGQPFWKNGRNNSLRKPSGEHRS